MDNRPERLDLFIGGGLGPSFELALEDGVLVYRHSGDDDEADMLVREKLGDDETDGAIEPLAGDWRDFRLVLDRLAAWDWGNYVTEGVVDGTHWSATIDWDGRRLRASGNNAYPLSGAPDTTPDFERFCAAVSRLAGGRDFA